MAGDDSNTSDGLDPIADFLEGSLAGDQLERFSARLAADPEVIASLVDSAIMHDMLTSIYADQQAESAALELLTSLGISHEVDSASTLAEPAEQRSRFWKNGLSVLSRYRNGIAALAAMLLVVSGLIWTLFSRPVEIATITRMTDVQFDSAPLRVGTRLAQGQRLQTQAGVVEITYDSGAVMAVKAPADVEFVSKMLARSRAGKVTVDVGEHAHGFTIETPTASVVDWGTEFGVGVQAGETDVVVFKGAVDLHANQANVANEQSKRLLQGDALRVGTDGGLSRIVSMNSREFPILNLSESSRQSQPAVIASVSDNIRGNQMAKCYRIVHGGLHDDATAYVDRSHQWNGLGAAGLPKFLQGADYIMTFNDDKRAADLEVTVTFARDVDVYVLFDKRRNPPKWLTRDFTDLGVEIGLDEGPSRNIQDFETAIGSGASIDAHFGVWKASAAANQKVVFGSQFGVETASDAHSMYGIAASAR